MAILLLKTVSPPPIIEPDLFNKVQERIKTLSKSPIQFDNYWDSILHSKLYCGRCGAIMILDSGKGHLGKPSYRYYNCRNHKYSKGCKSPRMPKSEIEDIIIGCVIDNCLTKDFVDDLVKKIYYAAKCENPFLIALGKNLNNINDELQAIDKRATDGELTQKSQERSTDLRELKETMQTAIEDIRLHQSTFSKSEIRYALMRLCVESNVCKRALANTFLISAIIYDDKVEIKLRHPEKLLVITLPPRGNIGKRKKEQ